MAARKLAVSTVVSAPYDENNGFGHRVLLAGEEVPEWAVEQVGDHCYEQADGNTTPARKTAPAKVTEK